MIFGFRGEVARANCDVRVMHFSLPEPVLESLREHYYAGVMEAEIGYEHNAADEDSVTGALGQSLLTTGIRIVEVDGQFYGWRANPYKLGGRGKGALARRSVRIKKVLNLACRPRLE